MEYCKFKDCQYKGCESHPNNTPAGAEVTEEGLEFLRHDCFEFQRLETQEKIRNMTRREAWEIIHDLKNPSIKDEMKGAAIRLGILRLETHNSVTKAVMLEVIRYLFKLCFEETGG